MKASELRIGNYFIGKQYKQPDDIFICKWISDKNISGKHIDNKYECSFMNGFFVGIHITEEWLVKFGLEGKQNPFIKYPFEFFIDDIGNCSCYYKGHCLSIFSYVHQLQNLYFALTGEELTVKQ